MWTWIKRVFFGYVPPPATSALAQLDEANIELGRQIDELRAQRKVLVAQAADLREQLNKRSN